MASDVRTIKERLYIKYGTYCEVCGRKFKKNKLTGRHIVMKCKGGKATEDNILIACYDCHFGVINNMTYGSTEYWNLMYKSLKHRKETAHLD